MSLLFRPVRFANSSSSEDNFSGRLTDKTERMTHPLYYNTLLINSCQALTPQALQFRHYGHLWLEWRGGLGGAKRFCQTEHGRGLGYQRYVAGRAFSAMGFFL